MSKKLIKILFIFLFIFCLCVNFVYATDINLNLPGTDTNTAGEPADENITANDENTQNPVNEDANQSAENSVQDDSNTVDDGSVANTEDPFTNVNAETLQPGGITTSAESGLGVTNIINILLITVGVILILLAIAIIIRLKG